MKIRLKRGFSHLGRELKPGDEFTGDAAAVGALIQQGYADAIAIDENLSFDQGQNMTPQTTTGNGGTTTDPSTSPAANGNGNGTSVDERQDTFSLDEGPVILIWPDAPNLAQDEYQELCGWLDLMKAKIGRTAKVPAPTPSPIPPTPAPAPTTTATPPATGSGS